MTFRQCRINVDTTSWRCIDLNATLYKRHVPAGFLYKSRFFRKNAKDFDSIASPENKPIPLM